MNEMWVCVEIGLMVLAEEIQSTWKIICLSDAFSTTDLMHTGLGLSPTTCNRGQRMTIWAMASEFVQNTSINVEYVMDLLGDERLGRPE
jgi:hypothetical protein